MTACMCMCALRAGTRFVFVTYQKDIVYLHTYCI